MLGVGREMGVGKIASAPPFLLSQAFVLSQEPAELQFQQNHVVASESEV